MKKFIALVLAVLLVAGMLVACGGGDSGSSSGGGSSQGGKSTPDEKTDDDDDFSNVPEPTENPDPNYDPFAGKDNITLTVWAPQKAQDLTKKLCADFIAKYPNKKISITVAPVEEGDAAAKIINDPEVAADVFSFASDQLIKLKNAKVLSKLTSANENIVKYRDDPRAVKAAMVDGKLYAFPETGENGYYLVYDKKYLSEDDVKTFEGLLAACKREGLKFNIEAGNGFYAYMFLLTGGLQLNGLTGDMLDEMIVSYDEEKVLDALEAFNKLFTEYTGKDLPFQTDGVGKIGSGMTQDPQVIVAGIDGSWNAAVIQEKLGDRFGATKLPTINIKGVDTQIISINGNKLLGVNARSKYTNAAQLLAEYLASEECQLARAEELSWSPSNKNLLNGNPIVEANLGSAACLAQADYAVSQTLTTTGSYSAVGAMGAYISSGEIRTRDDLKKKLATVIEGLENKE